MNDVKINQGKLNLQESESMIEKHINYQRITEWIDKTAKKLNIYGADTI